MCFPTEQQAKVINHTGKPLVVIAAPGTGKTRTIVTRMIKLLKEDPNREVSFITFTRTSRKDTESKVRKMGSGLIYCTVAKSDRGLPANTVDITLPENISQYKLEAIIEKLTGEDFSV